MVSLQYELLNVYANELIGKTTLYTGNRYRVSHLDARYWNFLQTLFSVGHQMLLLVCLEFGRFPSAPPAFLHNQRQVHLEHLLLPQKAEAVSLLLPHFQRLHHI
jgi:hypothetical protein